MKTISKFLFCFLALLLLAACASATPVNPNLPKLANILKLAQVRSIHLEDDWDGVQHFAPVVTRYDLRPNGGTFVGQAQFSAGGKTAAKQTKSVDVSVPTNALQAAFDLLVQAPLQEGKYEPYHAWDDDASSLVFKIELENETITFYTTSQGSNHTPWGMTYQNKTYMIDSDIPMKAFKQLDPHLKHNELKMLMSTVDNGPLLTPPAP